MKTLGLISLWFAVHFDIWCLSELINRTMKYIIRRGFSSTYVVCIPNPFRKFTFRNLINGPAKSPQLIHVRATLLTDGLPPKPPRNLYDFSCGPTQALGFTQHEVDGSIMWRRRELKDTYRFLTCRQVSSFLGQMCPAHDQLLNLTFSICRFLCFVILVSLLFLLVQALLP